MYFAAPVRSIRVIVLAKEVPFNINIISFPYAGMDCFKPIGKIIFRKILYFVIPKDFAASIKFLSTLSNADLNISAVYAPVFRVKAIIAHQKGFLRTTHKKDSLINSIWAKPK